MVNRLRQDWRSPFLSASEEHVYRDVLRRYTDTDAIDQSDLRHFLEGVGFKPRTKPERDLLTPSTWKGWLGSEEKRHTGVILRNEW